MDTLLAGVDEPGFGRFLLPLLLGSLPNALDMARTRPRHAYQVFSVGSQRLSALNGVAGDDPFHDDVGYAAIIGRNQILMLGLQPFVTFQAVLQDVDTGLIPPYWPWLGVLNQGPNATDSIVPEWSAQLGVPAFNEFVPINHTGMGASPGINDVARNWLNRSIPRGAAHRAGFVRNPPVSERNAYDGSTVGGGGVSSGAGLKDNAIVKVELGPQEAVARFEYPGMFGTKPNEVGLRRIELTGMIRVGRIGAENFRIRSIHGADSDLHDMGALPAADLHVPAGDVAGSGADDYVTFRMSSGRIGRRFSNRVIGPTGESAVVNPNSDALMVYRMAEIPGGQSPPARASVPNFVLPPPTKGGAGNLTVSVDGAVEARGVGGAAVQTAEVRLYHNNAIFFDKLLEVLGPPPAALGAKVAVPHPAGAFNGLLVPYDANATLSIVGGGVQGGAGSSGVNPAAVYQYLLDHDKSSTDIAVP